VLLLISSGQDAAGGAAYPERNTDWLDSSVSGVRCVSGCLVRLPERLLGCRRCSCQEDGSVWCSLSLMMPSRIVWMLVR
jgi:hypothetical protein